jgi:hypothetical protein
LYTRVFDAAVAGMAIEKDRMAIKTTMPMAGCLRMEPLPGLADDLILRLEIPDRKRRPLWLGGARRDAAGSGRDPGGTPDGLMYETAWVGYSARIGRRRTVRVRTPLLLTLTTVLVLAAAPIVGAATGSSAEAPRRPSCTITGTNGNDRLHGTAGPDVICARGGDDHVYGRGGDDVLLLGTGQDHFYGGRGEDRVYGGGGRDNGGGGRGDDRILLQGGPDWVQEEFGSDLLVGGRGRDGLQAWDGIAGNDRLFGGPGRDAYCADPGDVLRSVEAYNCG